MDLPRIPALPVIRSDAAAPQPADYVDDWYTADEISRPIQTEDLRQYRVTFNVYIGLFIVGSIVLLTAVPAALRSGGDFHPIQAGAAVIFGVIGGYVKRLNQKTRTRLEEIRRDRDKMAADRAKIAAAERITDPAARDRVIAELALRK